jgi:hypothetical protein
MTNVPGQEVDIGENLYRCITTMDWWVPEENRPSSAAFKQPNFSTDVVSIAGSPEYTLRRFPQGCGLVSFNYGDAKVIGYSARLEVDPDFPDNRAHANVYNGSGSSKRKTMAQKLAQKVVETNGVVQAPSFAS